MVPGRDGDLRRRFLPDSRLRTRELLRRSMLTGLAILIPLVVTLLVLGFVVNFLSQTLDPLVGFVQGSTNQRLNRLLIETTAVFSLFWLLFVVGFLAEFGPGNGRVAAAFDEVIASIPGVGSVYSSFDEMSELLLDSDTESFQEVKLVEYPTEGSYTVAFKTADGSPAVAEATGHEAMTTLFMPMAPNPVMGGFVVHVPTERVYDVDMTIEEGIRSIVTSGVTAGTGTGSGGLSASAMRELGQIERIQQWTDPGESHAATGGSPVEPTTHRDHYDGAVGPEHAKTPTSMARRADEGTTGGEDLPEGSRPAAVSGDGVIGEATETRPAEQAGRNPDGSDETETPPAEVEPDGDRE